MVVDPEVAMRCREAMATCESGDDMEGIDGDIREWRWLTLMEVVAA